MNCFQNRHLYLDERRSPPPAGFPFHSSGVSWERTWLMVCQAGFVITAHLQELLHSANWMGLDRWADVNEHARTFCYRACTQRKTSDECVRATGAYFTVFAELFPTHAVVFVTIHLKLHYIKINLKYIIHLKYNDSSAWQQFCLLILMRCTLAVLLLLLLWLPASSLKHLYGDGAIVIKLVLSLNAMSKRSSQYAFHDRPDRCTHL